VRPAYPMQIRDGILIRCGLSAYSRRVRALALDRADDCDFPFCFSLFPSCFSLLCRRISRISRIASHCVRDWRYRKADADNGSARWIRYAAPSRSSFVHFYHKSSLEMIVYDVDARCQKSDYLHARGKIQA